MRYSNGEEITKDRMEDEDWYNDYQCMCEWSMFQTSSEKILKLFNDDYREVFGCEYSNQERLIRWSEHLAEINEDSQSFMRGVCDE